MEPIVIAANRKISYDARKAAIIMGPLLYCFESIDNGSEIEELGLYAQGELETKRNSIAGKEIIQYMQKEPEEENWKEIHSMECIRK